MHTGDNFNGLFVSCNHLGNIHRHCRRSISSNFCTRILSNNKSRSVSKFSFWNPGIFINNPLHVCGVFSIINNLITQIINSLLRRKQILNLSFTPKLEWNIGVFKYEEWESSGIIRILLIFKNKFQIGSTNNNSTFWILEFFSFYLLTMLINFFTVNSSIIPTPNFKQKNLIVNFSIFIS